MSQKVDRLSLMDTNDDVVFFIFDATFKTKASASGLIGFLLGRGIIDARLRYLQIHVGLLVRGIVYLLLLVGRETVIILNHAVELV